MDCVSHEKALGKGATLDDMRGSLERSYGLLPSYWHIVVQILLYSYVHESIGI